MTLEIRGVSAGLLDEPFLLDVRGAAPGEVLLWRARYRDDDLRVWRAAAARAGDLSSAWRPAKPSTGPVAALGSLRPVRIDVRVEASDGRAAARTVTRTLLADGVRVRRWREPALSATLYLPTAAEPVIALVSKGEPESVAGPLLASRGALVLAVSDGVENALERLQAVPGATEPQIVASADIPLPPNVGATDREPQPQAWDDLLARLALSRRLVR
jgi:hypothetical protein